MYWDQLEYQKGFVLDVDVLPGHRLFFYLDNRLGVSYSVCYYECRDIRHYNCYLHLLICVALSVTTSSNYEKLHQTSATSSSLALTPCGVISRSHRSSPIWIEHVEPSIM